jgi:hypothetical protein
MHLPLQREATVLRSAVFVVGVVGQHPVPHDAQCVASGTYAPTWSRWIKWALFTLGIILRGAIVISDMAGLGVAALGSNAAVVGFILVVIVMWRGGTGNGVVVNEAEDYQRLDFCRQDDRNPFVHRDPWCTRFDARGHR